MRDETMHDPLAGVAEIMEALLRLEARARRAAERAATQQRMGADDERTISARAMARARGMEEGQ